MRSHGGVFASITVSLPLSGSTAKQEVAAPLSATAGAPGLSRYFTPFIGTIVLAIILAFNAFQAPALAQTITVSSAKATPAAAQPGQTVVFTATMTANQNASNYPVEFSLLAPGATPGNNTTQQIFSETFKAGVPLIQTDGWTVPAGTKAGTYTMEVAVFNPTYSALLAQQSIPLTITAATAATAASQGQAAYPVLLEFPVISGTAQVGQVLSSTTGTWKGATSVTYNWSGNNTGIAGATAATYTPVASDVGHALRVTVTATGSPGLKSSATSAPTVPIVAASSSSPPASASGSTPFVALHTYYMSPTGSDGNNGTSPSTPWATPNHAVVCGDVIIAAQGTYNGNFGSWGKVSTCPSTTGGIDGTGGVNFATLLCAGKLQSCNINCATALCAGTAAMNITASNWAIEGWAATGNGSKRAFQAFGAATGTTILHHIAFINDIAYNSAAAFGTDDGGMNHNVPGNGVDEFAVVGDIAYASNQDPICVAAIDDAAPANYDTSAGTHVFWAGNFAFNNRVTCVSDGEGMMFDTFDAHAYTGQSVIEQNMVWQSTRGGVQITYQGLHSGNAPMYIFNNTLFSNNAGPGVGGYALGEINVQSTTSALPYPISIYNNISRTNYVTTGNQGTSYGVVYAALTGGAYNVTWGGSGTQNIFKGEATTCLGVCDAGKNVVAFNGGSYGTNTYADPGFTNPTDLLANRSGSPNCSAYANVNACMASAIADLTPTATGMTGKGYRPPGACVVDPYFPTWLKGVVYLSWNGSTLSENGGLISKPCNM
jgi:hypothetical protein